ncbi:hypothetical protein [Jiangella alkaliphila]|uniref:hypothetical protein n=1 Tax=Jiangella alkaliphila TaxID=419479 RepID=UPI00128C756E|nr:hypothetical protein [Jiangella alkaliphila]
MTTSRKGRQAAQESLSRWRAQTAAQKRTARHAVVVDRVVSSMAMEKEPVSAKWTLKATAKRKV